jgi:predicted peptidase
MVTFLAFAVAPLLVAAQQKPTPPLPKDGQSWNLRISRKAPIRFLVSLPEGYEQDRSKRWPFILFLHGAGERGADLERVRVHGPAKEIAKGRKLPFIVVSPQCPDGELWDVEALTALTDQLERRYRIDKDREYLTGLSMGGFGTWDLAAAQPGRFAAIAPICGGGSWIKAWMLAKTPIWATHGDADPVVPIDETRRMVDHIRGMGNREVRFDIVPGGGHDVWTAVYAGSALYDWFLAHKRS